VKKLKKRNAHIHPAVLKWNVFAVERKKMIKQYVVTFVENGFIVDVLQLQIHSGNKMH